MYIVVIGAPFLQDTLEAGAFELFQQGDLGNASKLLMDYSKDNAGYVKETWLELFDMLIAKYRDGYKVNDMNSPWFSQTFLFYPFWWLQISGFYAVVSHRLYS